MDQQDRAKQPTAKTGKQGLVTRRTTLLGTGAAVGSLLTLAAPAIARTPPLTKLVFSLDFIPLGRHAPWYAALAQGYFERAGLDVKIIPGQGTAEVIQAVDSGVATIGFVDVPSLVLARAEGSKIKMVAINYEKAPYAVFSLDPGANVTRPAQLADLTLASGAGSFTPKIIKGFMAQHGLNPNTLKLVDIAPSAKASALLTKKVPAIEFFVMSQPELAAQAKAEHSQLRTLLLSDFGLQLYSNGIGVPEAYLEKNADVVKRFVKAALQGWKFTFENPSRAADDEIKYVPSLKKDFILDELKIVRHLAVTPDVRKYGLGWFSPEKMKENLDFVVKYVGVKGTAPKVTDLYAEGFLPTPPIKI